MPAYTIIDGSHTPTLYVGTIDKVSINYTSTTNGFFAIQYNDTTTANADKDWLNNHFGERFSVGSHPHPH